MEKKTCQLLKVDAEGKKFSVVYRPGTTNPYVVYRHTWSLRECGYGYAERKRIDIKYADFRSCLQYLEGEYR